MPGKLCGLGPAGFPTCPLPVTEAAVSL